MKITMLVMDVGNQDYGAYTLPFHRKYCEQHGYDLHVVNERIDAAHPSWYKLICHKIVDTDIVVCCDLDIIPMPYAPPIHKAIDPDKINICFDRGPLYHINHAIPEFKYNCGLIVIPKSEAPFCEEIYAKYSHTDRDYWEQMYFNEEIYRQKKDINVLSERWNLMVCFYHLYWKPTFDYAYFKHLTFNPNEARRLQLAKEHYNYFFDPGSRPMMSSIVRT